jgi:hypothetical protein
MEERHPPLLWQLVMLLASAMTVATLTLSISIQLPSDIESMLRWADTAVCGIFFLDFLAMIMGIAIFGSLTAVITSLVLEPAKEANDPILAKLEKIEAELAKLRSRLEES